MTGHVHQIIYFVNMSSAWEYIVAPIIGEFRRDREFKGMKKSVKKAGFG